VVVRERPVEEGQETSELLGEVVGAEVGRAPQGARRERVGARRPADAEIDASRVDRLQHAELLGHHQRGVVRQHHTARADPDGRCGGSQIRTAGADEAIPGMLWCSATQWRR
jgi:hypothetical protein